MYSAGQLYLPAEAQQALVYATPDVAVAAPVYVTDSVVGDASPMYVADSPSNYYQPQHLSIEPRNPSPSPTAAVPVSSAAVQQHTTATTTTTRGATTSGSSAGGGVGNGALVVASASSENINRTFVDAQAHPLPPQPTQNDGKVPYAVVVRYLQLANKEIERLYKAENELKDENSTLESKVHTLQQALADQYIFSHNSTPALTSAPQRPYLGLEVTEMPAQNSRIPGSVEVVVKHVVVGHGAFEAGVQQGDILRKWNGLPIRNRSDFGILVHNAGVGSVIKLQIERSKGQQMVLRVEVQGVTAAPIQTPSQRGWATPAYTPHALPPPAATPGRITEASVPGSARHAHHEAPPALDLDHDDRAISQLAQLNTTD